MGFNETGKTAGPDVTLAELFAAQAARTPERIALVAPGGVRLTYRELDERAGRLALRLRALGVGPEVLAGVLMDRTAELIVALLAIHKAGGAYAPLDPNYPRQRVLLMLETAKARVLVTRRHLAASATICRRGSRRSFSIRAGKTSRWRSGSFSRPCRTTSPI